MAADVRIKRIYEQASPEDGARLLVDRVWPRGVTKEAAALTAVAQGDRAQHRVAQMVRSRARALRRIPPPLPRRDQGQRAGARAPSALPRGWSHDAALCRPRSGAQQRGRACGLSARSGREAACPSFGVSRATGPRAIVRVAIVRCAARTLLRHGCADAPDAAHRLCPAADDAAGDGAGPPSHHRGGGAPLRHFPQPPDEGGADAGAGRFHRRAARPRRRAAARAPGRRHQSSARWCGRPRTASPWSSASTASATPV